MSKGTILVVEDDVALLEGIRDILELDHYEIITASSGVDGLECLRNAKTPPDLIVSDIMMPKMDGYQFFDAVRAEPRWVTIPFIFLTAKGEKADIRLGKGMGVDDYVAKPFDSEDLLVAVDSRLRRSRQLGAMQSNEMAGLKRNILTILNHEFRTPLTYVVAYADMVSRDVEDLSPNEFHSFLQGIQAGSERLRRLIENFIFLVELETGEAEETFNWRKRPFNNFKSVFEAAAREHAAVAEESNVTFVIEVAEDLPYIDMDEEYMTRVIDHLVENAVKFSKPEGGRVTLKAEVVDDSVQISVIDEGRGMMPHVLKKIFEPFYQIDREHYEDQGAGSGLAIAGSVVAMHGGTINAESVFGEGSTFFIKLPILEDLDRTD